MERLSHFEFLRDYMRQKRAELAEANARDPGGDAVIPELRRLTNMGSVCGPTCFTT